MAALGADEALPEEVRYSRDIRPILADNCFKCHGPDDKSREADFRLDLSKEAFADRDGHKGIVPGKPDESEVVRRMTAREDEERMPPLKTKKQLTARQIALVRRWIEQGAKYEQHWSFIPPGRPAAPKVRQADWPRNGIDGFILERLEAQGLAPSPEADRYTLIRRVSLDLIGLPPTPAEVDAFVADKHPQAFERLVDRLLESPHYGERWARRWLDLARYSDTNGYEKDLPRSMWPYRDWVIDALNSDMPFDRFTIEQIAGDMLPGATASQRVATGFHRNTMFNEEGGIDPQEDRFLSMVDRVGVTGTVWLGLTIGCAQCHTHKYDPITHREFYSLFACLNNADEPEINVHREESARKRATALEEIARLEDKLAERFPLPAPRPDDASPTDAAVPEAERRKRHLEEKYAAWLKEVESKAVDWTPLTPVKVESNLADMTVLDDGSVLAGGDQTKNDIFHVTYDVGTAAVTAIRLEVLPHESLPAGGPGRRTAPQGGSTGVGDFFLSEFQAAAIAPDTAGKTDERPLVLHDASQSYAAPERSAAATLDGESDTGWTIAGRPGEAHWAVYRLKEPLSGGKPTSLKITLHHESFYPAGIGRFRISVTTDPRAVKASVASHDVERLLLIPGDQRTAQQNSRLRGLYLSLAPELAAEHKAIAELRKKLPQLPTTLVMQERLPRFRRTTHRHHRGEFLKPQEIVEPGVPEVLHPFPEGVERNRMALARWLVDERNPLVARVTMNRQWATLFGRGLVRTTEDFGIQGELPTHPALLDWLATEFVRRGWSLKQMHRLIVTSATYRQSSKVPPELLERDPRNDWLARSPRLRLDAESIRDDFLAVAGLLSAKVGGPSVFPPQPASVTAIAFGGGGGWNVSKGEDRYRRGLYTFNKRTAPYAMFLLFDAPSGEACVPRRVVSNTSLQALTLMNDQVFVEAAQAFARRVIAEANPTAAARARYAFRLAVTRWPEPSEEQALVAFFTRQQQHFASGGDPKPIVGEAPPAGVDLAELAAWTITCRSLLNLDEAVMRP